MLSILVLASQAAIAQRPGTIPAPARTLPEITAPKPEDALDLDIQTHPWTLKECINHALENNIELQRTALTIDEARIARKQSRLNFIPSLNAGSSSTTTFGRILTPDTYDFRGNSTITDATASVQASTVIFAGLRKHHEAKRSDLGLQAALLKLHEAHDDIALNVTAAYLEVLFAKENIKITEKQLETLVLQVEQTSAQVDEGNGLLSDLLQLQAQMAEAEYDMLEADNELILAYFELAQLLEIRDYHSFTVVFPEHYNMTLLSDLSSSEEIYSMAQSLPQIEAAKVHVSIAETDIKIAKGALYPTLTLTGGYGSSYSDGVHKSLHDPENAANYIEARYPFKEQIRNNASAYIYFNLNIPIFNSATARNNVRIKNIALQRANYDLQLTRKQVSVEIQQAFIDAHSALEQYNASVRNVDIIEETFLLIKQEYNLGRATPVDYSIALYNLINAESQLIQAKYQYIFSSKILDFYRGMPIELY